MTSVKVRMYDAGFGDAFLITVGSGASRWRMLVDCGVHPHGRSRPIAETVGLVLADLTGPDGVARVDVIVATHRHADHIVGFADDRWAQVQVGEVWLPYVEDPDDPVARRLQHGLAAAAEQVAALAAAGSGRPSSARATALALAANARGNERARLRLTGGTHAESGERLGFASRPTIRYLPALDGPEVAVARAGVRVHALGPSRDDAFLRRMNPPAGKAWLGGLDPAGDAPGSWLPFADRYVTTLEALKARQECRPLLSQRKKREGLRRLSDDQVLVAASRLESWCNNTSLFLVVEVGDEVLVLPGDAQQGAWEHVLADEGNVALLGATTFYKVSHHGSHNGTPRRFVEEVLPEPSFAMLPWGRVANWPEIPKAELLEALDGRGAVLLRADAPAARRGRVRVGPGQVWSELTLG